MATNDLQTVGRSTLYGKTGVLVGFAFGRHPIRSGHFISMVVYRISEEFVLCLSEGPGKGSPSQMCEGLGKSVPASLFAPFAQRSIAGLEFDELRRVLSEEMTGMRWVWHGESAREAQPGVPDA